MTNIQTIPLKTICSDLKLDPRLARMMLRDAIKDAKKYPTLAKEHKPKMPWEWQKGSKALEEAVTALKVTNAQTPPQSKNIAK